MPGIARTLVALTTLAWIASTPALSAQRGGGGGGGRGGGGASAGASRGATATKAAGANDNKPSALDADPTSHIPGITKAIAAIDDAIATTPPANLTPAEHAEWDAETQWLTSTKNQLNTSAKKLRALGVSQKSADTTNKPGSAFGDAKPSAQAIADANVQFLAMQRQIVNAANRKYQTLSNASKARHDIALSAIRNMK